MILTDLSKTRRFGGLSKKLDMGIHGDCTMGCS